MRQKGDRVSVLARDGTSLGTGQIIRFPPNPYDMCNVLVEVALDSVVRELTESDWGSRTPHTNFVPDGIIQWESLLCSKL
jgi:hypothetical protein